jgi:hypothetical protein
MRVAHGGASAVSVECCTAATYLLIKKKRTIPMFNLFKSLISHRGLPLIAEVERDYLNASVSRIDLERRQREVEGGLFRRSSFDL